ncbi:MAG: hypothetical protein ABI995_11935, partial [Acidobacteriota bacterium]
ALEYLESVLPVGLRRQMAAQFEGVAGAASTSSSTPNILEKLEKLARLEKLPVSTPQPLGDD